MRHRQESQVKAFDKLDGYEVQRSRAERHEKNENLLLGAIIGCTVSYLALLIWEVVT